MEKDRWFDCTALDMAAPRQQENLWNELDFLARGRAETPMIHII